MVINTRKASKYLIKSIAKYEGIRGNTYFELIEMKPLTTQDFIASIEEWLAAMRENEKSENTIKTYRNALNQFRRYLEENGITEIDRSTALEYKESMKDQKDKDQIKPATINSRLIVLNKFFKEHGLEDLTVKLIKQQNTNVKDDTLTETDFNRLIRWADKLGMERERLIMQTLAGTGIRISELEYFTVENLKEAKKTNHITVENKGKIRTIIVPDKIRLDLLKYAKRENITAGVIFHSKLPRLERREEESETEYQSRKEQAMQSKLIDKSQIWRNLKYIAGQARVKKNKVHAHSFRHLFAKRYLKMPQANILDLADYLGHSSLETTRIYTKKTSKEQKDQLNEMFNLYQ